MERIDLYNESAQKYGPLEVYIISFLCL